MKKLVQQDYNVRREIEHRIDRLDRATRSEQIDRSRAFKDYNIAEQKLNGRLAMLKERKKVTEEHIADTEAQLKKVHEFRKKLGFEHEIIITEHALLRYLQRYENVDIEAVHQAILKLPKKDVTKFGNTIVTVYPSDDDDLPVENS